MHSPTRTDVTQEGHGSTSKKELSFGQVCLLRMRKALPHGFEVIALGVTLAVCMGQNVSPIEVRAHAYYALATMSMVLCTHACRIMAERAEQAKGIGIALFRRDNKVAAEQYFTENESMSEELKLYFATSTITVACWIICVVYYAKSVSEHSVHSWPLGLGSSVCFGLALWKVICISKMPECLTIEKLADAFGEKANTPAQ